MQTPTGLNIHHWGGMSKRLQIATAIIATCDLFDEDQENAQVPWAFDLAEKILAEEARRQAIENGQAPAHEPDKPTPESDPLNGPPLSDSPILLP